MAETEGTAKRRKRALTRIVTVASAFLCLVLISVYLLATIYLRTPSAARRTSQLLTDYLHYPVTVAGLTLAGRTLSVNGLTVGNPAEFKGGELASARSIAITPDWRTFLGKRKSFDEIAIRGLRVTVGRSERGAWNFNELARRFAGKKGGGETAIRRLSISDSSLAVEGFRLDKLALNLRDLSTRGTTGSRFLLTGKDAGGNPLRLEGNARLGAAPSVEVVVTAPSFSLQTLARTFGRVSGPDLGDGRGALALNLKLHDGKLTAQGKLGVEHLTLDVKKGRIPVNGELAFAGIYDLKGDELSIDECSLRLDGAVRVHASGTVRQVRNSRSFAAAVSFDRIDLKALHAMLPPELRRDLAPAGTLSASVFRFSGDAANGVTAGNGALSLRGGEVAKGGRLLVKDLVADASLVKVREGWQLRGRLAQGGAAAGGLLQAIDAPFTAGFSSRLKPLHAEVPNFAVTVSGFPAEGKVGYRPGDSAPLTCRLDVRKTPLSRLNRSLAGKNVTFSAGTAALSLQAAGRGPQEFKGKMKAEFADLRGNAAGKKFSVKDGVTEAEFNGIAGKVSAAGGIRCSGGLVDDRKVDFACSYGVREGEFYLADGTVRLDRSELRLARLRGPLPVAAHAGGVTRLPLRLALTGMTIRSGAAGLDDLSGKLAVDYVSGQGRRLEGSGAVAVRKLLYKGDEIGSLAGEVRFTDSGAAADLHGKLLDGRLTGTANLDPFAPQKKIGFSMNLDQARCERLAAFEPAGFPVKTTSGLLDVKLAGSYERKGGLRCRMEGEGRGIALTGKGGKTVLTDGGVRALCELAGGDLVIREGVAGAGKVTAHVQGELARVLSPARTGEISLALAETSLDALLDTFINILPRGFQEASASGTMGAAGRIRISSGQIMLDGTVSLGKSGLDIPSQKFSADGMTGTIPFSVDLTGAGGAAKREKRSYSRDKYPALLAALRQAAKTERSCRIARVRFGGTEFGETSLAIRAGNGLVEITSLKSALFEGALLGEGFFRYGKNMQYGADLIVNNLSLRALCNASPKIKGYISGRVDGIVSLYGEGKGAGGLRGFTEIWTRSAPGEEMLVSKEFLQKLAGRKFKGIFFRTDRPYDRGEIRGYLENGFLTFDVLDISHTNLFGIKDLSVTVAPVQNRISLGHLLTAIREAATRGKAVGGAEGAAAPPVETEFKWEE